MLTARLLVAAAALVLGGIVPATAQVSDHERARLAVNYLLAAQLPSGLFRYDFDFLAGEQMEGNNIVRQVAAAYILAEYHLHARDERLRHAIEATLTASDRLSLPVGKTLLQSVLERTHLFALPVGRYKLRAGLDRFGLLYRPSGDGKVVSQDGRYSTAHSGATALGLLAELRYYQATADNRFGDLRSAWLEGLLSLWIPGRGFRISPDSIDDTPFYDGEAWLALAHYNTLFPANRRVATLLESLEGYLMKRYASDVATGFYQWGTMAAAQRFKATSNRKYLDFIRAQAQANLRSPRPDRWRHDNNCAEVEGLATAARVLQAHEGNDRVLLDQLEARLREDMERNRMLQISPNATRLAYADGAYVFSPRLRDFAGAFLEGRFRPYTRIDHTQHCLSALLKLTR